MYWTRSGNTRTIAEAIAGALRRHGTVEVLSVEDAPTTFPVDTDLVIAGGPTEGHGVTDAVTRYLDHLQPGCLRDISVAAFDTRLGWPRWLSGSAATTISRRLAGRGADLIAQEESFIVTTEPGLKPGEAERAAAWGETLAAKVDWPPVAVGVA